MNAKFSQYRGRGYTVFAPAINTLGKWHHLLYSVWSSIRIFTVPIFFVSKGFRDTLFASVGLMVFNEDSSRSISLMFFVYRLLETHLNPSSITLRHHNPSNHLQASIQPIHLKLIRFLGRPKQSHLNHREHILLVIDLLEPLIPPEAEFAAFCEV